MNRNVDRNFQKWEHNSYYRRGVSYNGDAVKNKFAKGNGRATADRKLDRGRNGEQALNVGQGGATSAVESRRRPKAKPNVGQLEQGLKDRSGKAKVQVAAKAKTRPNVGQLEQGLKDRSGKAKGQVAAKAKAKVGAGRMPSMATMVLGRRISRIPVRQVSAIAALRISRGRAE